MKCRKTRSEFLKKCFLPCKLLFALLFFAGCSADPVYIAEEIKAQELWEPLEYTATAAVIQETEEIFDGVTVYYTESGSVWHTARDCSALKHSTNVVCATREQAESEGKNRACKKCS